MLRLWIILEWLLEPGGGGNDRIASCLVGVVRGCKRGLFRAFYCVIIYTLVRGRLVFFLSFSFLPFLL